MKNIFSIILLSLILFALCSCAKDVNISIIDAGNTITVNAKTGTAVSQTLEEAGISLAAKDEVSPSLDSEISEDTKEIVIKRYAKVTVIKGKDSKTIEMTGGTVQDAIDKSGFAIGDGEELDHNANEYLTDNMVINIIREVTVTLTVDGKTGNFKTKSATVKDFLNEHNVTLNENDEINRQLDALLENSMDITVKRVVFKEEKREESIDFETVEKADDSMYNGESKTIQEGAKGEKEITYKVKYVDGKEVSKEKISEKTTKEPTDEIVAYGTKSKMLTEDEVRAIAEDHWNIKPGENADGNYYGMFVKGPEEVSGKQFYACNLSWRHNGIFSRVDTIYVEATGGEVYTMEDMENFCGKSKPFPLW